jgi:hypothetical protein
MDHKKIMMKIRKFKTKKLKIIKKLKRTNYINE